MIKPEASEDLKFYKIDDTNVVIAVKPDEVEKARQTMEGKGHTLTECEKPECEMVMLNEAPPMADPRLFKVRIPHFYDEPQERTVDWDGPCCTRCKNKHNVNSDWCFKHYRDERCFRFKLE